MRKLLFLFSLLPSLLFAEVRFVDELEDGDHYLSNQEHLVQFFKAMDAFLQLHL